MKILERPIILSRSPKRPDSLDKVQDVLGMILCVCFLCIAGLLITVNNKDVALYWIGLSAAVCPMFKLNN